MAFAGPGKALAATIGIAVCGAAAVVLCVFFVLNRTRLPDESPSGKLHRADTLAWVNRWNEAKPLYVEAAQAFRSQSQLGEALYAEVSQIPADQSVDLPATIWTLTQDLAKPEASDPKTKLRILMIRGMLEINYDAGAALATWQQVANLAENLHQYTLATRATGEQGIASFILGDTENARKKVLRAWGLSKIENDPASTVRYESAFGAGLVHLYRYKEALGPLDEAIKTAANHRDLAYPSVAIYAKIDALAALHQYDAALRLANDSLARLQGTLYDGELSQVHILRGVIEGDMQSWAPAIVDYRAAVDISSRIDNYRGVTDAAGLLAKAYEQVGDLPAALSAINQAIAANAKTPDELYMAPRNLATKAEITARLGRAKVADGLYRSSIALVNGMIEHAPTTAIQRSLLTEMSEVYSEYFVALCGQRRYDDALQDLEAIRGRIETEALEHHATGPSHPPTQEEQELTRLNIELLNTDDPTQRESLTNQIYDAELRVSPSVLAQQTFAHPVHIPDLQRLLSSNALLIEYVLAEPNSFALAVTHHSVTPYALPSKSKIESDAQLYLSEMREQKSDIALGERLYSELVEPIAEYHTATDLIVVPDGLLNLLPFSALADHGSYLLKAHTIDVVPSSTALNLLEHRRDQDASAAMPYIGVAAWTQAPDSRNFVVRALTGPQKSQLVALPDSRREVEDIAADLPKPNTVLLGADATETHFKHLPLDSTEVIHLALHGFADLDYPDRSALVFAPDPAGAEDGLLQVREIRKLHLKTKIVTLSACDTGVGPVAETGVINLVNAFIEAGADTVVSTLWELEDHSTEHLMRNFYAQLALHRRKVDALRTAQLDLMNQGLPPYYWASFQIVGDPDGSI